MNTALEQRLKKCTTLPTLSAVAIEVLQRCKDENLDFAAIAKTIGRDPALAVKILKMANSPLFGLRHEVKSISQALGILGLNSVRALVLSFSLVRDSEKERKGPMAAFWKRSVLASIAARELCTGDAKHLKEEAYLAGLLQDIGVMALARTFGADYEALHTQAGMTHDLLRAAERETYGADHAELGAWLLEKWGVPADLAKLVRFSHDSRALDSDPELGFLARCVEYSGRLADLWSTGDFGSALQVAEAEGAVLFGEGKVDISSTAARVTEAMREVAPLFELELDNDEMTQVLEQAQEVMASSVMRLEAATESLRTAAKRDSLTGVYNRGSLDAHLRQRFQTGNLECLGVLFADIDHFKKVNDTHGHAAGDAILRSVAQRLSSHARSHDFVARYGGEEFIVVLELTPQGDIVQVAERIRAAIEKPEHPMNDTQTLAVTASVGCAVARAGAHLDVKQLLEEADQALYHAKRTGRNKVVLGGTCQHADPASCNEGCPLLPRETMATLP